MRTVLLTTYRRWGRVAAAGDPLPFARRVLVTAHLSRWRRLVRPEQLLGSVPDRLLPPDEELLAALRGLPPRARAVVVLHYHEDLSVAETAELLGCPEAAVAAEASEAVARLREVLAPLLLAAGGGTAGPVEDELRDRLAEAAGYGGSPGEQLAAADAVIERGRADRRRRAALLAAAVCALLLLLALPAGTGHSPRTSAPPAGPAAPPPPLVPGWTEPPRGSLAQDTSFPLEMRGRSWDQPSGVPAPQVSERSVAFAGDVSGIRWVLVVGPTGDQLTGRWFTGPAGMAPGDLDPSGEDRVIPGLPVATVRADATGATLLVVGRPGDDVEVSPAVTVDADGKVRRPYASVDARDGIAVIREAGTYAEVSLRYRVLRNGLLAGVGPSSSALAPPEVIPGTDAAPRRAGAGTPAVSAFRNAVVHVLSATGLGPPDVSPVLLWSGPVPAPGGVSGQGSMVAMTMPSGALVVGTAVAAAGGPETVRATMCGSSVFPAGTALDDVVAVVGCEVTTTEGTQRSFVVSAPAGYDRVTLRSSDGRELGSRALSGSSGAIADPGTVTTAVLSGPARAPVEVTPADPRHDALDVG